MCRHFGTMQQNGQCVLKCSCVCTTVSLTYSSTKGLLLSIDIPAQRACQKRFVRLRGTGETVFDGASLNLIIYSCFRANRMICRISWCDRAFFSVFFFSGWGTHRHERKCFTRVLHNCTRASIKEKRRREHTHGAELHRTKAAFCGHKKECVQALFL